MARKTIDHPPLACLVDCMAGIDQLDADDDRRWVLQALNGRYGWLLSSAASPRASWAGGPAVPLSDTPLDGSAHADRAGRTFQAVKAQDGRPAVAEP